MIKNILLPVLLLIAVTATAQIEKIDTDRPDQTESPFTVPKNWMQFEMGFSKGADKYQGRFKDIYFEHPTLLSKYGVSKCAELRLITTYATSRGKENNTIIDREHGLAAVELGGKVNLVKEKGLCPRISLLGHYDFARLRTLFRDTIDGANFRFTLQHTLSQKVAIGYNLGMEWDRFDKDPAYVYTLTTGFNLGEKWYAYIEAFGSLWKNESPEHSVDSGVAYYISDDLKLDISSGFGINKKAQDNYVAIGASFRFKTGK
jgi:hypothetical protein